MNQEKRGWLACIISLLLAALNLVGVWIAGILCVGTFLLAFYDFCIVYCTEEDL